MDELELVCEKKIKKAKKKKESHEILENIPEEISSFQELQQACQNAADTVVMNIVTDAVHFSLQQELEPNPHAIENVNESTINSAKLDTTLLENEIEDNSRNEENVGTVISSSFISDEAKDGEFTISEQRPVADITRWELPIATTIPPLETVTTSAVEEKERNGVLKPSVFVGKSKLYGSSLQIGNQWDRSKYNVVLLPDLSKIVYPDLNSLTITKPKTNAASKYKDFLADSNIAVDRSSKPKPITVTAHATDTNEMNHAKLHMNVKPENEKPHRNNKCDMVDYKLDTADSRFTDYIIDGVDFRVFMNPVKWNPVDNYQLVIFRVGPVYYEEFFTNCGTTKGFIRAIKERADSLAKRQLQLAQTCLLTEFDNCKSFRLPTATLVIYGNSDGFDWTSKWLSVRFGVNEAFYEESFTGCKCFEDLIKAVKSRADIICAQQKNLKAKAYTTAETIISDKMSDALLYNLENYDVGEDMIRQESKHSDGNAPGTSKTQVKASISTHSDPSEKSGGIRKKLKSLRNWLKGTFSKKTDKSSSPSQNMARGGSSNDIVWQWNDSPDSLPTVFLNDDSENGKE